ncbi:hypothetical protein ATOP_17560 [Granulimonas faecalis]|uniref:Uncharacterized protein n=1 Tax=Granulimonas faecalis TaxID=2894155 RepID=A0AAV5B717_9ACTN|nr:hypothetical protein ATOP_17560 [Granulimonas faecalis]
MVEGQVLPELGPAQGGDALERGHVLSYEKKPQSPPSIANRTTHGPPWSHKLPILRRRAGSAHGGNRDLPYENVRAAGVRSTARGSVAWGDVVTV